MGVGDVDFLVSSPTLSSSFPTCECREQEKIRFKCVRKFFPSNCLCILCKYEGKSPVLCSFAPVVKACKPVIFLGILHNVANVSKVLHLNNVCLGW